MQISDFNKLKYFNYNEICKIPGEKQLINKISPILLTKLDALRHAISIPIKIICINTGNHTSNSLHYKGQAVDFYFVNKEPEPEVVLYFCLLMGYKGIGLYNNNKKRSYHVDIRCELTLWQAEKINNDWSYSNLIR